MKRRATHTLWGIAALSLTAILVALKLLTDMWAPSYLLGFLAGGCAWFAFRHLAFHAFEIGAIADRGTPVRRIVITAATQVVDLTLGWLTALAGATLSLGLPIDVSYPLFLRSLDTVLPMFGLSLLIASALGWVQWRRTVRESDRGARTTP